MSQMMSNNTLHRPRTSPVAKPAAPYKGPMKKIVMERSMANHERVWLPGREYELPAATAERLIAIGDARELTELEKKEGVKTPVRS
jgi:hypothetical protein